MGIRCGGVGKLRALLVASLGLVVILGFAWLELPSPSRAGQAAHDAASLRTDAKTATLAAAQLSSATWYAPYVDATLPPEYQSADRSINPAGQTAFGFIVATRNAKCTPSWGDYFSLSGINSSTLHLGSVISAMRAEGELPIVSFGGEANQPLADACTTASALASAYEQVINAYGLKVVDFDIEGAAQGDTAGLARQAQAIKAVQARAAAQGSSLGVWLTLPVAVTGMLPVAENVVNTMLNGGVAISGVNLMTMYFSPSPGDGAPMLTAVEGALNASHTQLQKLFASHGIDLSSAQVWHHMGATVQIGQAGVANQAFTVTDAQGLVSFAEAHAIGRISDWSANQDTPCGSASNPTVGGYSTYCSGVVQTPGQFGQIFGQLTGSATVTSLLHAAGTATTEPSGSGSTAPPTTTTAPPTTTTTTTAPPTTTTTTTAPPGSAADPSSWSSTIAYPAGSYVEYGGGVYEAKWWSRGDAPTTHVAHPWDTPWELVSAGASDPPPPSGITASYPAWSTTVPYPAGYLVERSGDVYKAKWWNKGDDPAQAAAEPWDTPWTLVGPVAPGTQAWVPPTLPAGTYPAWSVTTTYVAGQDVLFNGVPFQSKWWNNGDSPAGEAADPSGSPWKPLFTVPGEPAG